MLSSEFSTTKKAMLILILLPSRPHGLRSHVKVCNCFAVNRLHLNFFLTWIRAMIRFKRIIRLRAVRFQIYGDINTMCSLENCLKIYIEKEFLSKLAEVKFMFERISYIHRKSFSFFSLRGYRSLSRLTFDSQCAKCCCCYFKLSSFVTIHIF